VRTLTYFVIFVIGSAIWGSEPRETDVASLLTRSDAVIIGQLRKHGGVCATGGIYAGEHFDVLSVLVGTVTDSSVSVGFQWRRGEPAVPAKLGEKMVLFLKCPIVPVEGYWIPVDVHAGAQPYSEALETTIRKLSAR
jgi:hypothetical protein